MKNLVLLVDDNPSNLIVFEEIILQLNLDCIKTKSATEAFEVLESNDVSLILLDVQLPDVDGFELLSRIRQYKKWTNIPVIMISAIYKENEFQIKGIELGALDFILKPVLPELLAAKIKTFVELYEYRKQQEKALIKEQRERKAAEDIINTSPIVAFRWKSLTQGTVEYVSENVEEISGYSVEELITGKVKINDIVHPEDLAKVYEELLGFMKDLSKSAYKHNPFRIIKKDGEIIWVEERIFFDRREDGYITEFKGVIHNITDKIVAQNELIVAKDKAEESNRLKTAFLANMSHEIRTPMNAIIGFSQLLAIPGVDEKDIRSYVDTITNAGVQLLRLIDDIISISRIEAGIVEIKNEIISTDKILNSVYKLFAMTAEKKNLKFSFENKLPEEYKTLSTDPRRLQQVLINLLSNAFKFTSNGEVKYGCNLVEGFVEFFIKDTGIGISKSDEKIIFDRFRKIDHGKEELYGGTGIGLSISKAFVEKLGGQIWVVSDNENGAELRFTIPATKSTVVENTRSELNITKIPNYKGKTVLIAEDEVDNYKLLEILINQTGAEAIWAKNGNEALKFASDKNKIDLIFMDIKMPVMDGIEATRELRKLNIDTPIIAQTAYAQLGDKELTIVAGCNDYIAKPINRDKLFTLMSKYL